MSATGLLQELIRIPSVNPEGVPGVDEPGEGRLAEFLGEKLMGLGAEVSLREVRPRRPNVVARFPARREGLPRLLLAPHTDTVSVGGMTIEPFGGEVSGGRVWGRGACDTKGPMAAILEALGRCREVLGELEYEVWFAGLMGEEAGLLGSRALASEEVFDFVIVGEPSGMRTICAHKGAATLRILARGRSVHASMPESGVNAIELAMNSLGSLRRKFEEVASGVSHPILGVATMSVGTIRGGTKSNIVPDLCVAEVDVRTVPGFDLGAIERAARGDGVEVEVAALPSLETGEDHPMVRRLASLGAGVGVAPWFCDAAAFAERGMPAVALGPGSIEQAHTADEWIAVEELERGADFFEAFLRSLRGVD